MGYIVAFLLGIVNAMLINNVTLSRFYGICPFLGVSKKSSSALGMGVGQYIYYFKKQELHSWIQLLSY